MTKAELRVLEKAFEREINGAMLQSKSKIIDSLVERGYLTPHEETFGSSLGPIVCKGFVLTHLGRLEYCSTC